MIKDLIKKSYKDIFDNLYALTNGSVIMGGSLSLRYLGIIDRNINDLDVTFTLNDWLLYKSEIQKHFRVIPNAKIKYENFEYEIYTCFDIKTKLNEFHLFVNYESDIFSMVDDIRILKPDYLLKIKSVMIDELSLYENGNNSEKHISDMECIKMYLDVK